MFRIDCFILNFNIEKKPESKLENYKKIQKIKKVREKLGTSLKYEICNVNKYLFR